MSDKLDQAWTLFMEGQLSQAKELVAEDFQLETCKDFSLLNLMGYLELEEKNYPSCFEIFKKYLSLAQEKNDFENEHVGLHQLAMIYREMENYETALKLISDEEKIIACHFPDDMLKLSVNNYEKGYLRLKLGLVEESLKYMNRCLMQALETDDVVAQACGYRGLGEIYLALEQNELAKEDFKKALELFKSVDDKIGADEVRSLLEDTD